MGTPDRSNVGFLIRLIYDALGRQLDENLKPMNLTHSQALVIAFLKTREGIPTSITDIRNELKVSAPTALGLVQRLEKKGFARTYTDKDDHRIRLVFLNSDQMLHVDQSFQDAVNMEEKMLEGLSSEEREKLADYLNRVYQNIR